MVRVRGRGGEQGGGESGHGGEEIGEGGQRGGVEGGGRGGGGGGGEQRGGGEGRRRRTIVKNQIRATVIDCAEPWLDYEGGWPEGPAQSQPIQCCCNYKNVQAGDQALV